ncbi:MAG: hypothetical protein J5993_03570 [Clostridia bacterium]|nr:hypothetical protein [Clostridia bacterium]
MEKYQFVEKKEHTESLWTKETWGMTLCLFGGLGLLILLFGIYILGKVGAGIVGFLLGSIGYFAYPLFAFMIWMGVCLIRDKKPSVKACYSVTLSLAIFFAACIVHTAMSASYNLSTYGIYLASCFQNGLAGYSSAPFGGLLLGFIVYPLLKYTTMVGAILIFSLMTILFGGLFAYFVSGHSFSFMKSPSAKKQRQEPAKIVVEENQAENQEEPVMEESCVPRPMEPVPDPVSAAEPSLPQSPTPFVYQPVPEPRPNVRSVHEDAPRPEQPFGEAYLQSMERFENVVQQYMAQQKEDTGDPYTAPIYRPGSDYQRRNERFYNNAEKVLNQPVRAKEPEPYANVKKRAGVPSKENGKSILYPDKNYDYQSNLIFDSESQFNAKQTNMRGGYKPINFYPQAEQTGDGPRKIVTDTTHAEEPPYFFHDTQENAPSPYSRRVENVSFNRHDESREQPRVMRVDANRPIEVVQPTTKVVEHPVPERRAERIDRTQPATPERFTDRTQPVTPERIDRTPPATPERIDRTQPATPERFTDRTVTPERVEPPRDAPVNAEQENKGDLSFSSIFSSSNNNTGRTQFDLSKVNSNKFADRIQRAKERDSRANLFDDDAAERTPFDRTVERQTPAIGQEPIRQEPIRQEPVRQEPIRQEPVRQEPIRREPVQQEPIRREPVRQEPVRQEPFGADRNDPTSGKVFRAYKAPPFDFFEQYQDTLSANEMEIEENSKIIVDTLGDFRIEADVMKVTSGPTVTRYDIEIPRGIQARKVASYDEDIARRLHVQGGVTIYPNFESGYISIEVPNKDRATVGLAPVLMDPAFRKAKSTSLMFGMGKDVEGRSICGDIVKMTHMLVAGSTGSGKSVFLNELIVSLMMKYSPEELRMILVDPKQVEFVVYQNLPHLMINEIVNDPTRVISILSWAIEEMQRRYTLFQQKTQSGRLVRNIDEYNDTLTDEPKLPKIVIIIDELADLMLRAKKEIEDRIQNLTQKSRAAGIHMVIATQRPSVDVITGVIKSNLPTRVAFRVAQEVDSRTILDDSGAEKLLGKGDMLYKTAEMPSPYRLQCAYLSSEEVQRIVEYVKENNVASFDQSVTEYLNASATAGGEDGGTMPNDEPDPVYIEALRYVVMIGQASISMIQRRCGVGYNRAGKIIEWMESMGYISPFEGAKARTVLLSKEEFEAKYGAGEE